MILLIDNYDSFTYNLVQRLGEIDPTLDLEVHRNDKITIEEIEDAALLYVEARDKRMEMLKEEVLLKEVLDEVMKQHDQTKYVCREMAQVVEITEGKDKLTVSKMKADIVA